MYDQIHDEQEIRQDEARRRELEHERELLQVDVRYALYNKNHAEARMYSRQIARIDTELASLSGMDIIF